MIQFNRAKLSSPPKDEILELAVDGAGGGLYASGDAAALDSTLLVRDTRFLMNHANQGGGDGFIIARGG